MITKYKINKDELLMNIKFLYEVKEIPKNFKSLRNIINLIIRKENIKFNGNKIIIYINGIFIGEIYLTNFYLEKMNYDYQKKELNETNSYFNPAMILEIKPNPNKKKTKKVLVY